MNFTNLTENQKLWLTELLTNEIEEASCAAKNEHLWALGSDDEQAEQHETNAEEQRGYVEVLKNILKETGCM